MSKYIYKDCILETSNKKKEVRYIEIGKQISKEKRYNPITSLVFTYTTSCPFNCKFCYLSKSLRKQNSELDNKLIDNIIKNIKEYDIPYVDLLGGEPFSKNNIEKTNILMKKLNKNNIEYHISTTAPDILKKHYKLFKNNIAISISWHGFDSSKKGLTLNKEQEKRRNNFMKWLSVNNKDFGLSYVITELDNKDKMIEFFEYILNNFNIRFINLFYPNMYTFKLLDFYKIAYPVKEYLKSKVKVNINAPFNFKYSCAPQPKNSVEKLFTGCSAIKSKLEIYKDGTIYPCCLFFEDSRYSLGKLSEDIYQSIEFKKYNYTRSTLENSFKKTDKTCSSCNYNKICESCPAKNIYDNINFTCHG